MKQVLPKFRRPTRFFKAPFLSRLVVLGEVFFVTVSLLAFLFAGWLFSALPSLLLSNDWDLRLACLRGRRLLLREEELELLESSSSRLASSEEVGAMCASRS